MRHRLGFGAPKETGRRKLGGIDGGSPTGTDALLDQNASLRIQRDFFAVLSFCLAGLLLVFHVAPGYLHRPGNCAVSLGNYRGDEYYSPESGSVGTTACLLESKWMKVSQHSVRFPGSARVLTDWLWIDYHDRVNVLVEEDTEPGEERRFLVFEQTKYALEGRQSLAIVGGIVEPHETAEDAARREVDEEFNGYDCGEFHFLGRYRTDVNRGMGWLNSYIVTGCKKNPERAKHQFLADEVGEADLEKQEIKTLTMPEIREAVGNGRFIEAQWTCTVALALLHGVD